MNDSTFGVWTNAIFSNMGLAVECGSLVRIEIQLSSKHPPVSQSLYSVPSA
jgi:hypothetical protein